MGKEKLPASFKSLPADLRRRASDAWRATHSLIDAIPRWNEWIDAQRTFGIEAGDAIARQGREAIEVLRGLHVNSPAFQGEFDDAEHTGPLYWWPTPPSEILDPTWYEAGNPADRFNHDFSAHTRINYELFSMNEVLLPVVKTLVGLLEQSPDAALLSTSKALLSTSKVGRKKGGMGPFAERLRKKRRPWPEITTAWLKVNPEQDDSHSDVRGRVQERLRGAYRRHVNGRNS
jgi:hypothetical protein